MYNSRGYGRSRSGFEIDPVYATAGILCAAWWILTFVFHAYDPFRSFLYWWNVNPWMMISLNMIFVLGGIALAKLDSIGFLETVFLFAAAAGVVMGIWNIATYDASVMVGLRQETVYDFQDNPLAITDLRPASYAEAGANFGTQNPDARFELQNINYVRDQWVSEYGPKGFWNAWKFPTQGFYEYNPLVSPNPNFVPNPMQFAEQGIAGNSLRVRIARKDPFAYYEDALFAPDPDFPGKYMTVVTLTRRHGMSRVPYVSNVVVIHLDNREEWLTAEQASIDPRFVGLQIVPEWLIGKKAAALGYTHGVSDAIFHRTDLVQVQVSSTNDENSPPYHLRSGDQMYWVTPLSPYNTPSFKALAWQESNQINAPTKVWIVPDGKAYPGVDALVSTIKITDGHPSDIKWVINNGGTLSGEIEILEMLPVTHNNTLYFVGYAALGSKPQKTRMFVAIRPSDSQVMQDMMSVAEVNAWLKGTTDLGVLTPDKTPEAPTTGLDLTGYSTQELWDLLDQVTDEIRKRGDNGGTFSAPMFNVSYGNDGDLYSLYANILKELWARNFK
jgi:hypothetical protein